MIFSSRPTVVPVFNVAKAKANTNVLSNYLEHFKNVVFRDKLKRVVGDKRGFLKKYFLKN